MISSAFAQKKEVENLNHEGKPYSITLHSDWLKAKQANDQVEHRSFYNAIDTYQELLTKYPDNEYLTYKLAMGYFKARDYKNAEIYFLRINDLKETAYPLGLYYGGHTLKMNAKYDLAKDVFRKFYNFKTKDLTLKEYKKFAMNEINSCDYALSLIEDDTLNYEIQFQEGEINKSYTDFAPIILGPSKIGFASLRQDSVIKFGYDDEKIYSIKMYTAERNEENVWENLKEYPGVNKPLEHAANGAFNTDSSRFYYCNCVQNSLNNVICHLYYKEKNEAGVYGKGHKAHQKVNLHNYTTTQPAVGKYVKKSRRSVEEKDIVYFVSDRPGGEGGKDIWFTLVDKKGKFSKPENCDKRINTPGDEVAPYYDLGTQTMYFSSNYHYGLGGLDVFSSRGAEKRWSKPENMKIPMNSSYDDTYFVPAKQQTSDTLAYGYLVSNRPGGLALKSETCCDDIYAYQEILPVYENHKGTIKEKLITQVLQDSSFVVAHADAKNTTPVILSSDSTIGKPLSDVRIGIIKTKKYNQAVSENKASLPILNEDILWVNQTDSTGNFDFVTEKGKKYTVVAVKDGYAPTFAPLANINPNTNLELVKTKVDSSVIKKQKEMMLEERKSLSMNIDKESLKEDEVFVLENVYFDSNVDTYKPNSLPSLKLLYNFLKKHPDIRVEISGHTDHLGSDEYNLDLSERRAESVVHLLIEKGIDPARLEAKGYGESKPIAKNTFPDGKNNEEGMAKNRRTEVKILKSKKK